MTTFVKFGGSVLTDKRVAESANHDMIAQLARAVAEVRRQSPHLPLLLSHGSGSFGHVVAAKYGVHKGFAPDADWYGFAATSAAALRLNRIVVDALLAAQVPAMSLQPAATVETADGAVVAWHTAHIERLLQVGLVPVVHGDVSFDRHQGCTIASTEMLLTWLSGVPALQPQRIVLVGEAAVYTEDPQRNPDAQRIPVIHRQNIQQVMGGAGGSYGIDVTGGMASKIRLMWHLVEQNHALQVRFIAPDPALLVAALTEQPYDSGTIMQWE